MRSDVVELLLEAGMLVARPQPEKEDDLKEDPTKGGDGEKPDTPVVDKSAADTTRPRQARLVGSDTIVVSFYQFSNL